MGRPKKKCDESKILELVHDGETLQNISKQVGVSTSTISRRLAGLRRDRDFLSVYQELQHLHITQIQFRVLEAITPQKIEHASLSQLTRALKVLFELAASLKPKNQKEVKSFVDHVIEATRLREAELSG